MELTKSQKEAFDAYLDGKSFFLSGKAGTGKSFLIRRIVDDARLRGKNVIVCAPTGVAALNVDGATLHRTFQAPIGLIDPSRHFCCPNKKKLSVIRKADIIIVDEISMCRRDLFEYVMRTLDVCGKRKKKQVILVGDFFQLPPVLSDRESTAYLSLFKSPFAFTSPLWDFPMMELTEVVRQDEKEYVDALNGIRVGRVDFGIFPSDCEADSNAVTICTTNYSANSINQTMLNKVSNGKILAYHSSIVGDINPGDMPTEQTVNLCVGARVIMLVNDTGGSYVNGSLGTVSELTPDRVTVELDDGGTSVVTPHTWDICHYIVREKVDDFGIASNFIEKERIGSFTQLPLKLAWAVTVHKSQGQTFDKVNINANDSFFADGQLYVCLSRCKTLNGLNVMGKLNSRNLKCSMEVMDFYNGQKNP